MREGGSNREIIQKPTVPTPADPIFPGPRRGWVREREWLETV